MSLAAKIACPYFPLMVAVSLFARDCSAFSPPLARNPPPGRARRPEWSMPGLTVIVTHPSRAGRRTERETMRSLTLWETYTRAQAHDIFEPDTKFTPRTGTRAGKAS